MIMSGLMWGAILWAVVKIVGCLLLGVAVFLLSVAMVVWRMGQR